VTALEVSKLADVTLVGHSWGGYVIAGAAPRLHGQLKQLIFWSAFVPEAGRSLGAEPQASGLALPANARPVVGSNIAKGEEHSKRGPQSQRGEVADSLTAAQSVTARALGAGAQMRTPQTGSGIYRGVILGETTHHVIQRQSAHSGIAHRKDLLDWQPRAGEHVRIQYANAKGTVRKCHEHARGEELGR